MDGLGVFVCFIAFIFIIVMIVMIIKFNDRVDDLEQQKEQEKKQKEKLVEYHVDYLGIPEELHDNVFETTIAGINYHATDKDLGTFIGMVVPIPENAVDHNAMGVVTSEGKFLGYIPKEDLKSYRKWCNAKCCNCVGFIDTFTNSEGRINLYARVRIMFPYNQEFCQKETNDFLNLYKSKFGEK